MDAKAIILEVLKNAGEPLCAGQIAENSELARNEVNKAIKSLKEEGLIVSPRYGYWTRKR